MLVKCDRNSTCPTRCPHGCGHEEKDNDSCGGLCSHGEEEKYLPADEEIDSEENGE